MKLYLKLFGAFLLLSAMAPRPAHAMYIYGVMNEDNLGRMVINPISCIIFLPICLFDKDAKSSHAIGYRELRENGYGERDAKQISTDQSKFFAELKRRNQRLTILGRETDREINSQVKSVYPGASPAYLKFLNEYGR